LFQKTRFKPPPCGRGHAKQEARAATRRLREPASEPASYCIPPARYRILRAVYYYVCMKAPCCYCCSVSAGQRPVHVMATCCMSGCCSLGVSPNDACLLLLLPARTPARALVHHQLQRHSRRPWLHRNVISAISVAGTAASSSRWSPPFAHTDSHRPGNSTHSTVSNHPPPAQSAQGCKSHGPKVPRSPASALAMPCPCSALQLSRPATML
jgi:hypothetical protein